VAPVDCSRLSEALWRIANAADPVAQAQQLSVPPGVDPLRRVAALGVGMPTSGG